jgi:hypothetical protein
MKINEVMLEASVDRKQFGKETVRANQKANIARSAAFRKQMDAPSAEEPAAAAPAATPAATPAPAGGPVNYGKGTPGIPNIQVTPTQKTPAAKPATQASPTPNYGAKGGAGTPVTLANPIAKPGAAAPGAAKPGAATPTPGPTAGTPGAAKPGATPTPGRTPVPGAGMPTPPGAGMPKPVAKPAGAAAPSDDTNKGWQGKGAGGNLPGASFLKGFTKAAGMTDATNAIDAAQRSNIDYDLMAKQKAKADADKNKQGEPTADPDATPAAEPNTAKPGQPVTLANPIGQPGAAKPGAKPNYGPKAAQPITLANPIGKPGAAAPGTAKPGEPVTLDDPAAKPGAAAPDKETTLANPIAKPGEEKPGAAAPGAVKPAQPAAAPAAATGKSMSKQEILSWISRNDEDNAALQSFKDAIAAAEKAGAPAGADYGKATPGIQNVQAAPGKVSYAPKTAAAAPKGPATVSATMAQPQMASKQYKKAPL